MCAAALSPDQPEPQRGPIDPAPANRGRTAVLALPPVGVPRYEEDKELAQAAFSAGGARRSTTAIRLQVLSSLEKLCRDIEAAQGRDLNDISVIAITHHRLWGDVSPTIWEQSHYHARAVFEALCSDFITPCNKLIGQVLYRAALRYKEFDWDVDMALASNMLDGTACIDAPKTIAECHRRISIALRAAANADHKETAVPSQPEGKESIRTRLDFLNWAISLVETMEQITLDAEFYAWIRGQCP